MDADLKSRQQVSFDQLNGLVEFLQEHQELAKGLTRGRRGKLHTLKLWNLCAKKLNVYKDGAIKDGKGWSKCWCDWKYRVRRRALELKAAKHNNRPPPDGVTSLSHLEEAILGIIGEKAVDGVVIKSDPLGEGDSEEEVPDTEKNDDNVSMNKYIETQSRTTRSTKRRKRQHSSRDLSDLDDNEGPSSPQERKPRFRSNNDDSEGDDDETAQFLRLEREKLESTRQMNESIQSVASAITRLCDVVCHIRDLITNNRLNINNI